MAKPRRGYSGRKIKLPPLAYERTSFKARTTYVTPLGHVRKRPAYLPVELPTYTPPPQRIRNHRNPLEHVELLTSGQAMPVNTEIPYTWRGRANSQARKVWAQIKDNLPSDKELSAWSKRHELLRDDGVVWE